MCIGYGNTPRASSGYTSYGTYPSGSPGETDSKPDLSKPVAPTLQELEAERSARRARRNRTCFTRQQVNTNTHTYIHVSWTYLTLSVRGPNLNVRI